MTREVLPPEDILSRIAHLPTIPDDLATELHRYAHGIAQRVLHTRTEDERDDAVQESICRILCLLPASRDVIWRALSGTIRGYYRKEERRRLKTERWTPDTQGKVWHGDRFVDESQDAYGLQIVDVLDQCHTQQECDIIYLCCTRGYTAHEAAAEIGISFYDVDALWRRLTQ